MLGGLHFKNRSLPVVTSRLSTLAITVACYECSTDAGSSSFEVNTEVDSNDVTQHPHDDKPRPYVCTVCEKRFMTRRALRLHELIHTGEKRYTCSQCEKRFVNQAYLTSHMNVHSSKYKCTECGKCFSVSN